jgi:hypothetical protein
MTNIILPTIGSSGYFKLKTPLSTLVIENEVYTCRAIRTLNDYLANNEDPLTDIYVNYSLGEPDYKLDLAVNMSIVSLQSDSSHWLYIPAKYIESYPLTNGIPYRSVMIGISLPSLPVDRDIAYVQTDLTNLIKDRLGVEPVIKQVETSRPVLVSKEIHDQLVAERALVSKVGETDSSRYQKLLVDFNTAIQKISMLEKYITDNYIKSIDYDPLTNHLPMGTFTIDGNAFNGSVITAYPALYDIEGVGVLHYQWYSGTDKVGTDDRFYTTTESDIDKEITCIITYLDGFGNEEHVKSSNSVRVKSKVNRPITGKLVITGDPVPGNTLTLVDTLVDPDGIASVSYTWKYTAPTSTTYDGVEAPGSMNSKLYVLDSTIPAGSRLYVEAVITDNSGYQETVYSEILPLADLSNRVFVTGQFYPDKTLTASNTITDIDHGLQYFWYYDDANGTPVQLMDNSATYVPTILDVGKEIYAKAVYVSKSGKFNVINSKKHKILPASK